MIPRTTLIAACAAALPLSALARPQEVTAVAAAVRDESQLASREPIAIDENNNILVKHTSPDILITREDVSSSDSDSEQEEAEAGEVDAVSKGKVKGGSGGSYYGSSTNNNNSAGIPAARPAAGFALVVGMGAVLLAGMMN